MRRKRRPDSVGGQRPHDLLEGVHVADIEWATRMRLTYTSCAPGTPRNSSHGTTGARTDARLSRTSTSLALSRRSLLSMPLPLFSFSGTVADR